MIDLKKSGNPIKLLWTGGWDSTFRLCELIKLKKVCVQPISTMYKIRSMLARKDETAEGMILPTYFFSVQDVGINKRITEKYLNLKAIYHLGGQYDWLARFIEQHDVTDLELCVDRCEVHTNSGLFYLLQKTECLTENKDHAGKYYKIVENPKDSNLSLFRGMKFPILHLSKKDMKEIAQKEGFLDILNETWFCHRPTKRLKPCGTCNPCLVTIEEGMRYRFTKSALLRASIRRSKRKVLSSENGLLKWSVGLLRTGKDKLHKKLKNTTK
jgi:hypothetical protein